MSYIGSSGTKPFNLKIEGVEHKNDIKIYDEFGNLNFYGVAWDYSYELSTHSRESDGSNFHSYAKYNEFSTGGYEYLVSEAYLYNFESGNIGEIKGTLDALIGIVENDTNFWANLIEGVPVIIKTVAGNTYATVKISKFLGQVSIPFIIVKESGVLMIETFKIYVDTTDANEAERQLKSFRNLITNVGLLDNTKGLHIRKYFDTTITGNYFTTYDLFDINGNNPTSSSFYDEKTNNYAYGEMKIVKTQEDVFDIINSTSRTIKKYS